MNNLLDLTNEKAIMNLVVPAGLYPVQCVDAEIRQSEKGGVYIATTFEVFAGEFEGRKIFHNFNIQNANNSAVEIGKRSLKRLMVASGSSNFVLKAADELIGLQCLAKTRIKIDPEYGDQVVITDFREIKKEQAVETPPATAAAPEAPQDVPF